MLEVEEAFFHFFIKKKPNPDQILIFNYFLIEISELSF